MSDAEETPGVRRRKVAGALATATAVVGLATGVLTLRDQLFSGSDEQAQVSTTSSEGVLTPTTASKLSDDVQLTRFSTLLGAPATQKRLQNDEWLVSTWDSPDIAVSAFSNRDSQVVAYTLTSLAPDYTPLVEYLRGGIRLRSSVFAEIPDEPTGLAGVYPPNGRYSYLEFYRGGGATQGKSVILAASFAANADEAAAVEIGKPGCRLPFSVFEEGHDCSTERLTALRTGLHVTSMTVGEASGLEALAQHGASFFPDADTGS